MLFGSSSPNNCNQSSLLTTFRPGKPDNGMFSHLFQPGKQPIPGENLREDGTNNPAHDSSRHWWPVMIPE